MKRKLMTMALAAGAALGAWADTETVDGIAWNYTVSGGKAQVGIGGYNGTRAVSTSTTGAITIPPTLGGNPVTSVKEYAFDGCSGLTSVTIPDGVTSIGENAFRGCDALFAATTIPGVKLVGVWAVGYTSSLSGPLDLTGVRGIGDRAFFDCSGLTSATIGNDVTSIGKEAFRKCSGLTSVTIPDGVTSIGSYCFTSCSGLTNVTIGAGVTSISDYVFSGCSGLTSVTIPDGVTSIGHCAFSGCSGLASVTIPDGVTSIGHNAFDGCSGLTGVTIPDGVTSIGFDAFSGCSDALFDTTNIPGVKLVDGWAFGYASSLSGPLDLTGVRGIVDKAFSGCSGLTSVTIPGGVARIGDFTFQNCSGLTSVTIPNSVASIGQNAFQNCSGLTSVTIPNSVTSIGFYAFRYCSGLTSATIGNGVTNIAHQAFYGCTALADVKCHPDAAALAWGYIRDDFKAGGSTVIHVKASQLAAYQAKFSSVKDIFVGDLPEFLSEDFEGGVMPYGWTCESNDSNYLFSVGMGDCEDGIGSHGGQYNAKLANAGLGVKSKLISPVVDLSGTTDPTLSFWFINRSRPHWANDGLAVYYRTSSEAEWQLMTNFPSAHDSWTECTIALENPTATYQIAFECNSSYGYGIGIDDVNITDTGSAEESVTPDVSITAGEYFKKTLVELGYAVPNDGATAYNVVAYGLPAGLKLKSNAAVTKKVKKGKKTTTVVVTPAKTEWWIEGVPTTALDYATNPPYLVITTNGVAQTLPLSLGVEAQEVMELPDLALGEELNEQFYLPGVTNGWTVSGLPAGLKYTAKLVTTTKKKGKKIISVTTNALPYSVYGKPTKAGLFTITAKKKAGAFYETMKYRVLVTPKAPDTGLFGDLTNITTMAYVPVEWELANGGEWDGGHAGRVTLPAVPTVAKVAGLPGGVAFASANVYFDKKKTKLKQKGQTIVGTPTKPGTYVVTFTRNVKSGKKTVAKTAQMLWTVKENDAELSLGFNEKGAVIESGTVGLSYGDLMAFDATDGAKVTASGLPAGIKLADLGDGQYAFKGFTAKAGTYLVTVTATLNGKTVTQRVALKVDGLPDWAKGTFNGCVWGTGNGEGETGGTNGLATVTVSSAGKISGKFQEFGTNWTFSASSYDLYDSDDEIFRCTNVVAKYAYKVTEKDKKGKKKTVTKYLTREFALDVSETKDLDPARGMVCMEEIPPEGAAGATIEAYQNLWGQSGYKTLGKKLFYTSKKAQYKTWASVEADGLGEYDTLSMKVTPAGVVTATYKFFKGTFDKKGKPQYATYTCTTVLHPETSAEAGTDGFCAMMHLYFPPVASAGFKKYSGVVRYPFTDRKANVPDKAAIDAAKWCAGEYLGYGYAEFPGEDWLYGIFRVSVGADLAFTGTFEAIDGGVADFSGKLVKNVANGVAITVSATPLSMGVKAMAKPYGKSKYGEIFAWSEAEEGQPNIHIDRAWQNIWTSVGMASARPKIAPGTTKTVDLAGAEIYRYPMGNYVEGDSFTYTFGEDGTVSVTGQVFGVPVDTTTAIAVETENGGMCDCILTFMINGRVFQQNFTMPSSGTVTSESISLDASSDNFGIING